ncbi:hypothetical protein I317_05949 [Kwoniella heveanensis CBS 569]|nr:hypothetical protein I317_05949 [Kwoniella heveanensis CBS 569]
MPSRSIKRTGDTSPLAGPAHEHQIQGGIHSSETAVFRHSPEPDSKLKREWEPGCQPDEVYDRNLPSWRAWLRRRLVGRLREENGWMAEWQRRVRTDGRDKYFYWTAIFGTHTFFMAFLPIFFFFGDMLKGRGLLHVVGLGIYVSSFAKDLVCTPRPYSPPVVRLSMSTHHHEYGFPSSHSTNSVSIALFYGQYLFELRERIGLSCVIFGWALLFVYAFSVVGGRLYTGMHSTADIIGGSLMGIFCWGLWLVVGDASEAWVNSGTWLVPIVTIPVTLGLVHYHPYPIDDCPCFEDAIAVLAVILGSFIGHWSSVMRPDLLSIADHRPIFLDGYLLAIGVIVVRLAIGLGIMFAWRLVAKKTLLRILPPLFRLFSRLSHQSLPTRRFYKSATDYNKVPESLAFRPIPSVVDLQLGRTSDNNPDSSPNESPLLTPQALKPPHANGLLPPPMKSDGLRSRRKEGSKNGYDSVSNGLNHSNVSGPSGKQRKGDRAKYDAEVLTKVVVYAGLGFLATTVIPALFGAMERAALV